MTREPSSATWSEVELLLKRHRAENVGELALLLEKDRRYHADQITKLACAIGMPGETSVDVVAEAIKRLAPSAERECETCKGDPVVCATVPGLRHCEAANRDIDTNKNTQSTRLPQSADKGSAEFYRSELQFIAESTTSIAANLRALAKNALQYAPSSTTEYTDRDRHQIKDAEHLIASSGEWMVQQIDANPSIHTPEFEMIHRLRHSLRDLYRIVSTGLSATKGSDLERAMELYPDRIEHHEARAEEVRNGKRK